MKKALIKGAIVKIPSSNRQLTTSQFLYKKIEPDNLKGKSQSSQEWLRRQLNDIYVKNAKIENYRARSAFKLIEIDDRFKILQPGHIVVECGASPGSWTQVAVKRIGALNKESKKKGKIIAVDLQTIHPIEGATILDGADFTMPNTQEKILKFLNGSKVDVVLSDMAPNASGVGYLDQEIILKLCIAAFRFSLTVLQLEGTFLCKTWAGQETPKFMENLELFFKTVKYVKPKASRNDSSELYFLARGFKGCIQTK